MYRDTRVGQDKCVGRKAYSGARANVYGQK